MVLWDKWQAEFLSQTSGDKTLVTGRQVGKGECASEDCQRFVRNTPWKKGMGVVVMIAPLEKQAFALYSRTLLNLKENCPGLICMKGRDKPTQSRIKLKNGWEIHCLPVGTGLNIRFLTIGRLYVDEASRVPDDVYVAIQPATLTTNADTIFLSTLNGAKGFFYDCWVNKDGAWNSFTRYHKSTEEAIQEREICQTWTLHQREGAIKALDNAKARMSMMEYGQEYLGIAMLDMSRFFNDELILKCCVLERRNGVYGDGKYYLGCDVSAMGEDLTTIEIVDKSENGNMEHVENIITQRVYTTDTSEKIIYLHQKYRFKAAGIDSNGVGFGVFSELLRDKSTKSIAKDMDSQRRPLDENGDRSKTLLKEQMYFGFLAAMEKGKIKLLNDESIIESLKSIQFKLILKPGEATRHEITGNDSHCVEGLIRAVHLAIEDQTLNFFVR